MNITQDILIGIALAMDCFAVSIASGITTKQFHQRPMIAMIAAFGLFQGGMTLLGWYVSSLFSEWLQPIDHWIAFGLLSLIAYKCYARDSITTKKKNQNSILLTIR